MRITRILLFFLIAFLISSSICTAGEIPQNSNSQFSVESGSLRSAITGIEQDPVGFIWVSTRYGLYKFDGYEFDQINILGQQRSSGTIRQLESSPDGTLWIRTDTGELIKTSSTTNVSEVMELPSSSAVSEIIVDSSGEVWVVTNDSQLYQYRTDLNRFERKIFSFQGMEISVLNTFFDEDYFYFNALNSPQMLLCRRDSSACEIADDGDEVEIWLLKDSQGRYWGRGRGGGIVKMESGEVALLSGRDVLVEEIVEDEDGGIWIGTSSAGLIHYPKGRRDRMVLNHDAADPESIASDTVEELCADNSGNVWVGTRRGLAKVHTRPSIFNLIEIESGLEERRNITAFFGDDENSLWAGIEDVGLYRSTGDSWTRVAENTVQESVLAIAQVSDGPLLLATTAGLKEYDPASGTVRLISDPVHINDVLVTSSGDIWIATLLRGYGKLNAESGQFEFFRPSDLVGEETGITATALAEDRSGDIWIGFDGYGLIRLDPDTGSYVQFQGASDAWGSLSNGRVNCVFIDHRDHVWIGTHNGLNRIDPQTNEIAQFHIANGLPDNFICSIEADDTNHLWISTRAGLARFSEGTGEIISFDSGGGLESNIFVVRSSGLDDNSVLYFGGIGGITTVNTQQNSSAADAPRTVITSFSVFGNPVELEQLLSADSLITIPYDQNIFTIEFAAMDFTRPSGNRFKYRLKGWEDEYSRSTQNHTVRYSRVQPGDYEFLVLGSNSSGVWSENPATVRVRILPPFWMTWQFRALAAFTTLALIFGLYKWRTTSIKRQRDLLQMEVNEREIAERRLLSNRERLRRMASELILTEDRERRRVALILHDQIAQSLIISKTRLDTAASRLPESGETIEFNKISSILNDTIKDTRSLTAEVSPPSLHRFGLEVAVKSLLDQYGAEYGIETAIIHEAKIELGKDLSVLLYRSIRELLINIIKHAGAKTVVVEIRQKGEDLSVMVQDDGHGFDAEAYLSNDAASKGFGLFSIQERIESLGGKFQIESDAEHGTLVIMEVPNPGSTENSDD